MENTYYNYDESAYPFGLYADDIEICDIHFEQFVAGQQCPICEGDLS